MLELTSSDSLDIPAILKVRPKDNVVSEFTILDPVLALDVSRRPIDLNGAISCLVLLRQQRGFESFLLIRGKLTLLVSNEIDFLVGNVNHLTDHRVQQTGFTRADSSDDDNEFALLDLQVDVLQADYTL